MVLRVAETNQPIKVLHAVHTEVTVEVGQGQAAVPPLRVAETTHSIALIEYMAALAYVQFTDFPNST